MGDQYGVFMLSRLLIGVAGAGLAVAAAAGVAAAQPPAPAPTPAPPNVLALPPAQLPDYAKMDGQWYAFKTPTGLTCVLQRNGPYGCSGALPAAPDGANLVRGGPGPAAFSATDGDPFAGIEDVNLLPEGVRLSLQTVSCATTGGGVTTCYDDRTQSGFVLSPAGSFIINGGALPLLDRHEGTNPFIN
ncbi:Uncharacterised protein [Mycolicibacterium phlei]|uniref:Protein kinase n=3 Tax=Mycolicibacterium phlei TaxID=1771 RepID=A0A5N5VFB7_MYCPH|nr:hypothetical protein MPHLCCUG_01011 [Mycolicibacterium phlei]KAB7759290.1 hypothetical protein MPHL21000_03485 [Mycolicibacterium phlei DSM 43239 = CCUG 21000]KXW61073.1 hypothetical protein MPHL43070_06905 [Mycolicibacterium phlei DSM 43070]VEG07967.1 Uncharacterised protein [Mycobacteroides chelonae]KXW61204.1 hypothetical protein MPHL43239_21455 [Mycolicibacterium phlei DSM 43239 = CCUG 21000]